MRYLYLGLIVMLIAGCASTGQNPKTTLRHNDKNLTCSEIESEATDIHKRAKQMIAEDAAIPEDEKKKSTEIMFIPLWFVMDLKDPLNVHLRAMEARTKKSAT